MWAYDGNLRTILANPTEATSFRRFDVNSGNSSIIQLNDLNSVARRHGYNNSKFAHWDDDKTPYPIPAEYIKDLIDRVIASEISISTKTVSDELRDNVDTTKIMQYGAQVQR